MFFVLLHIADFSVTKLWERSQSLQVERKLLHEEYNQLTPEVEANKAMLQGKEPSTRAQTALETSIQKVARKLER